MSGRSSRTTRAGIAIVLAAVGFISAAPAEADVINVDMTCGGSSLGSQVVTITTNDTLSVVSTSLTRPCDYGYLIMPFFPTPVGNVWVNGTLIPMDDGIQNRFPPGAWTMTFASAVPGSTHINLCGSTESPPICPTLVINVVQAPEDPAPAEIPEWQQSVGRPNATSTCDEGWQPSWQEWAQPITGGWVCTRSIPSLGD